MDLSDSVEIRSGRTFKNGIVEHAVPTHKVIQLRDVDSGFIDWDRLVGVNIETNREIKTLEHGQILVIAKGPAKSAVLLSNPPFKNAVTTQHFLILTVKNPENLLPNFLTFYLNSEPVQQWLNGNSGGSYQSSLSLTNLSKLPLPDMSVEQQLKILDGVESVQQEIALHESLIQARKAQLNEIAGLLLIK